MDVGILIEYRHHTWLGIGLGRGGGTEYIHAYKRLY
jgi:hypothetical protein